MPEWELMVTGTSCALVNFALPSVLLDTYSVVTTSLAIRPPKNLSDDLRL